MCRITHRKNKKKNIGAVNCGEKQYNDSKCIVNKSHHDIHCILNWQETEFNESDEFKIF